MLPTREDVFDRELPKVEGKDVREIARNAETTLQKGHLSRLKRLGLGLGLIVTGAVACASTVLLPFGIAAVTGGLTLTGTSIVQEHRAQEAHEDFHSVLVDYSNEIAEKRSPTTLTEL